MNLEISSYHPTHQTDVIDLWKKCNLIFSQNDPLEDIQKKLDFQPDLFFVALLKKKVVGSVMVGYDGLRGWLYYLAVLPEYQKRGYGKKLVEKAVNELLKLGCSKVNLQVRTDNASIVNFYKRLGFKEEERVSLGMSLKTS